MRYLVWPAFFCRATRPDPCATRPDPRATRPDPRAIRLDPRAFVILFFEGGSNPHHKKLQVPILIAKRGARKAYWRLPLKWSRESRDSRYCDRL